jgi:hypothetical protein
MLDRAANVFMSITALMFSIAAVNLVGSLASDDRLQQQAIAAASATEPEPETKLEPAESEPAFALHTATSVVRMKASDVPAAYLRGHPAQIRSSEKALLEGEIDFLARSGLNPGIATTSQRFPTIGNPEVIVLGQHGNDGSPNPRVFVVLEY